MAQVENLRPTSSDSTQRASFNNLPIIYHWLLGIGLVVIVMLASLLVGGPKMEFATTVSTSEVATTGGNSIQIERSLRQVTGAKIDDWASWLTKNGDWLFDGVKSGIQYALRYIENVLKWIPWPAILVALALLSYVVGRWRMLIFTSVAVLFFGFMGLWENTIDTVALMVVSVSIAVATGLPLGVIAARNQLADNIMRPILDAMQTMPSFVYLLPGILFFGLGSPAGIFATLIYAIPPVIRLTNLGIRQVSEETVEAARSFGASPWQVLTTVQIPMALPTIMAGINQTTMMALAMVTIASMVAAGGLGDNVLRALQKNQVGEGLISGLAIVFLAIIIDRLTQAVANKRQVAIMSPG